MKNNNAMREVRNRLAFEKRLKQKLFWASRYLPKTKLTVIRAKQPILRGTQKTKKVIRNIERGHKTRQSKHTAPSLAQQGKEATGY